MVEKMIKLVRWIKPPRTHCKRGHKFTEHNSYFDKNKKRHCKECNAIRQQSYRRIKRTNE